MQTVGLRAIGYSVGLAVSLLMLNPWGTSSVAQPRPDLIVTELGHPTPPSSGGWLPGGTFSVPFVTVANHGLANADPKPAVPPKPALTQIETKFYLVSGSVENCKSGMPACKNLSGVQLIGLPLQAGESVRSTNLALGVFSDTTPGDYSLQACADGGGDISEGTAGEGNNCLTATTLQNGVLVPVKITILQGPDLVITAVSAPETSVGQGQQLTVKDTVKNQGQLDAGPTTTRFYLVSTCTPQPDCVGVRSDPLKLPGSGTPVTVPKLDHVDEGPQKVTVPSTTAPGDYYLQACADGGRVADELNENNNCFPPSFLAAAKVITVKALPDLVVTSVAVQGGDPVTGAVTVDPSTKLKPLQNSFTVKVRVTNQGSAPTLAKSALRYSLLDSAGLIAEKTLKLPSSSAAVAMTPADLPPPPETLTSKPWVELTQTVTLYSDTFRGKYKLQVCADPGKVIPESVDNNNCTSTDVVVVNVVGTDPLPPPPPCNCDLKVTAVPNPPAATAPRSNPNDPVITRQPGHALPGDILKLTATVQNFGPGDARESTVNFFLVACPTNGVCRDTGGKQKNLKVPDGGGLVIEPLAGPADPLPGESVTPPPADFILYDDTLTGVYFLKACADGSKTNPEKSESNNCLTTPVKDPDTGELDTITIDSTPNLLVDSVDLVSGQSSTLTPGQTLKVKTTVLNTGAADAGSSRTKFYLVSESTPPTRKDLQGSLDVTPIVADGEYTPTTPPTLTIQLTTSKGKYRLQGCADAGKEVTESNEDDNCSLPADGPSITVIGLPNLKLTVATIQSSQKTVARGGTFVIKATVANDGETDVADVPAPSLKYFFADPATDAQVYDLNQPQTFPLPGGLRHGSNKSIIKTITVPANAPTGTFNVRVCADPFDIVVEGNEADNCMNSSFAIAVTP